MEMKSSSNCENSPEALREIVRSDKIMASELGHYKFIAKLSLMKVAVKLQLHYGNCRCWHFSSLAHLSTRNQDTSAPCCFDFIHYILKANSGIFQPNKSIE